MGCLSSCVSWRRTAPTPISEASVCSIKGLSKSGKHKTGSWHRASLISWKARLTYSLYWTWFRQFFPVKSVSATALTEELGTNLLYQFTIPRKYIFWDLVCGRGQFCIAWILWTWGLIVPRPITYPKYFYAFALAHLEGLMMSLAALIWLITISRCSRCSSHVEL